MTHEEPVHLHRASPPFRSRVRYQEKVVASLFHSKPSPAAAAAAAAAAGPQQPPLRRIPRPQPRRRSRPGGVAGSVPYR